MKELDDNINTRFEEIDVLKGIAIILVVLGHVLAWFYSDFLERMGSMSYNEVLVWKYVYSFHMPLFMFVSGFVVFNPHKKYKPNMICKRCISYLIPFIFFGILSSFYLEKFNIENILGQYWYFKTLVIFLVVVYLVDMVRYKFFTDTNYSLVLVPFVFSAIILVLSLIGKKYGGVINLILDSSHLDWKFFYFIVGWYSRRNKRMYNLFTNEKCFALAFVLMIIHVIYQKNLFVVFPLVAILFMLNLSKTIAKGKAGQMCVNFGKRTKDIYILHFFFILRIPEIGFYFEHITVLGKAPSVTVQIFVGLPICLLITYLSYKVGGILNRNKYISKYCFGNI